MDDIPEPPSESGEPPRKKVELDVGSAPPAPPLDDSIPPPPSTEDSDAPIAPPNESAVPS